ncbi:hypothetical protein Athai_26670 [Actinocatenispora thailandica]|uniref:Uncharacterized protein n=1 Tax=Actinocatenispora thailandica TaxID=227318 RepID=A0A7R7HXK1_9ACTN|nr:hypothetical protein [Actinocatenispora thailandica]BCJ35164.1 hypothetical protein Athai_26670 [Actinocatenispora thailandica]
MDTPRVGTDRASASTALRTARTFVGTYLTVSALAVAALVSLHGHPTLVTDASWVRASIVLVTAVLMFLFARGAVRGSRRAWLRLRIVSAVMLVAIAVIVSLPGFLPLWLRLEQGLCGLLLLAVVVLVNGRGVRSAFAAD